MCVLLIFLLIEKKKTTSKSYYNHFTNENKIATLIIMKSQLILYDLGEDKQLFVSDAERKIKHVRKRKNRVNSKILTKKRPHRCGHC
jgi:hypothetical protein